MCIVKTLLVDDNTVAISMLSLGLEKMLDDRNLQILTAQSFDEAVEIIRMEKPEIYVLDIFLDNDQRSGLELIPIIKTYSPFSKIIISSAASNQDLLLKAIEADVNKFFVKPIDLSDIVGYVKRMIVEARNWKERDRFKSMLQYQIIADHSPIGALITDSEGIIQYVNDKLCRQTGYEPQELIGLNPRIFKSGYHLPEFYKNLWNTLKKGEIWKGDMQNRKKSGTLYWESIKIVPVMEEGKPRFYIAFKRDITRFREMNLELQNIIEASNLITLITDKDLNLIRFYPENREDSQGKVATFSISNLLADSELIKNSREVFSTKVSKTMNFETSDTLWEVQISPLNGLKLIISIKDITERENYLALTKALDALHNNSYQLRTSLSSVSTRHVKTVK